MDMKKKKKTVKSHPTVMPLSAPQRSFNGSIFSAPDKDKCLDTVQLNRLEQSFREWTEAASRFDVRNARRRILLIFLIIRYTGAKLNEVLNLDPGRDIDCEKGFVRLGRQNGKPGRSQRKVQISAKLSHEIRTLIADLSLKNDARKMFDADPGFVRRKFYERAEACGIAKQLGAPEILRKSRAIELMRSNLPLPAVQMLLGHSTPNLTSSYVSFSEDDIQQATRLVVEKESTRKTSARNSFFGKIHTVQQGDIQTLVEIVTIGGQIITTVITNDSLQRLGLKEGKMITAEVKAPWVMLHKSGHGQGCSADNIFKGLVEKITRGKINTEYVVRIADGTEVCSIVTSESSRRLCLAEGDAAWVIFSSYSVVLLSE
jgi:molybdate transport system regulatory protein